MRGHLVLSRERGQEIIIGVGAEQIVVTLEEIRGHKARIGITAPLNMPVDRRELYERKKKGRERDAYADPHDMEGGR